MADYWVSQNRKYCDFCKCWITDNKPSVEFHEKGRRHQENVKKKLRNVARQSSQVQKESDRTDAILKQMEGAAMAAYQKDVENNADMTSVAINKKLQEENLTIRSVSSTTKLWTEEKNRAGKSCYRNIMTNEVVSQPPEDFLSVKEQREQVDKEAAAQYKAVEKYKQKESLMRVQQTKQEEAEEKARLAREKMKERRVVEEVPPVVHGPLIDPGKYDPYGRWQTVKETVHVDLQLPEQEEYYEVPVVAEPEPVVKTFKEKTVESLGEGGATFKKRKFGGGAKRNTRQRLDDD